MVVCSRPRSSSRCSVRNWSTASSTVMSRSAFGRQRRVADLGDETSERPVGLKHVGGMGGGVHATLQPVGVSADRRGELPHPRPDHIFSNRLPRGLRPGVGPVRRMSARCDTRTHAGSSGHPRNRAPSGKGPRSSSHATRPAVVTLPLTRNSPTPSACRAPATRRAHRTGRPSPRIARRGNSRRGT
jgi:hypothetical protein